LASAARVNFSVSPYAFRLITTPSTRRQESSSVNFGGRISNPSAVPESSSINLGGRISNPSAVPEGLEVPSGGLVLDGPFDAVGRVGGTGETVVQDTPVGMTGAELGVAGKEAAGGSEAGPGAGAPSAGATTGSLPWAPSFAGSTPLPPADPLKVDVSQAWAPSLARRICQPPPRAR
jgi:hypothetical protein